MLRSAEPTTVECTCSCCGHVHTKEEYTYYYDANITHNLNKMAAAVGLYIPLWRPEEGGYKLAMDLFAPLNEGIAKLLARGKDELRQYEPRNGWGTYENLLSFATQYLEACKANPDAEISVSR